MPHRLMQVQRPRARQRLMPLTWGLGTLLTLLSCGGSSSAESSELTEAKGKDGPTSGVAATVLPPPSPQAHASLAGDWILVSYHLSQDGTYFESPLSEPSPGDSRERWRLREDGTFQHIMGDTLAFSGTYQAREASPHLNPRDILPNGEAFLLETLDVAISTVPGQKRAREYWWGVHQGERLVLFYFGPSTTSDRDNLQGHEFRKSWKGGWTW